MQHQRRFHDNDGSLIDADVWVNKTGQPMLGITADDGRYAKPYVIINAEEMYNWLGEVLGK